MDASPVDRVVGHERAESLVARLFGRGSGRYRHMVGAARAAHHAGGLLLEGEDLEVLVDAAFLHDVGYAVPRTGFHSVDGAELLLREGWPVRVASLVAHHSYARTVAPAAGRIAALARFPLETGLVHDLLVYADMSVEPGGSSVLLEQRIADIGRRHVGCTPTGEVHDERAAQLRAAVARVDGELARRYAPAVTA